MKKTLLAAVALLSMGLAANAGTGKWCMLLQAEKSALTDDDETRAANWFQTNFVDEGKGQFIVASQVAGLDAAEWEGIWVMCDQNGIASGYTALPGNLGAASTIDALKAYSKAGGALYLSNFATQLAEPLGYTQAGQAPTVFGSGDGGDGTDVWCLNAYLGWMFKEEGGQGFYDRTNHAVYSGMTFEDPNEFGYNNLPLIGPGHREDHNCMWDCNIYGKGSEIDVIRNFEVANNCQVLATWGHVIDHCVAAFVDFAPTADRGACVANGLAAYEWNQNDHENAYQSNIEKLTKNTMNYLVDPNAGVNLVEAADAEAAVVYYNLQGVRVANPENGLYIRVQGNKAVKVVL